MRATGDFALHERLSRRRNRHIRLTRSSVCLLLAALLCWVAGLPWGLQLTLTVLAAAGGLIWPVRGSETWALAVISGQSGLAYETALAAEGWPSDEYGLRAQVRSRARSSIAGLEQPAQNDWWLAAFVVAIAILLLPALRVSPPWTADAPGPPPQTAAPADPTDEENAEDESQVDEQDPAALAEEALPPQAATPPDRPQEGDGQAAGSGSGSENEGMVLDRFLENLRERPQSGSNAEIPGTPVPTALDEPTDPADEESQMGSPSEDTPEEQPGRQSDSDGAGSDDASEQAGNQEQDVGEELPDEAAEPSDGSSGGDQPGDQQSGADGEAGDEGQGLSQGDGDGAGGGQGVEVLPIQDPDRIGEAAGAEELLQGEISSNEVNLGGDIRLPGFTDVELPPGSSPVTYGQAVERSLTEGSVPLEYQEIIRNYFR